MHEQLPKHEYSFGFAANLASTRIFFPGKVKYEAEMNTETFLGRVLGEWVISGVMGGDEPGAPEPSLEAHEKAEELKQEIEGEHAQGLIPPGKMRGITMLGPIAGPDGVKRTAVYKIEYDG